MNVSSLPAGALTKGIGVEDRAKALRRAIKTGFETLAPNHPLEVMQPLPSDDLNLLKSISQVPLATYTILHSLGTAHTPDDYYPVPRNPQIVYDWMTLDPIELYNVEVQWAMGLDIFNVRSILEHLTFPVTPMAVRTEFFEHNPTSVDGSSPVDLAGSTIAVLRSCKSCRREVRS
ncbi:hypothetical protein RUM44_004516 [Polyplax serrata]|uniref:Uncharacterized protein n=1 Tax=Polyplax serrata TaxID=468196 RepID=A0ABR1B339_POLSC